MLLRKSDSLTFIVARTPMTSQLLLKFMSCPIFQNLGQNHLLQHRSYVSHVQLSCTIIIEILYFISKRSSLCSTIFQFFTSSIEVVNVCLNHSLFFSDVASITPRLYRKVTRFQSRAMSIGTWNRDCKQTDMWH